MPVRNYLKCKVASIKKFRALQATAPYFNEIPSSVKGALVSETGSRSITAARSKGAKILEIDRYIYNDEPISVFYFYYSSGKIA
jgi:hypothetical protein